MTDFVNNFGPMTWARPVAGTLCLLATGVGLLPAMPARADGRPAVHKSQRYCKLKALTPGQRAEQQAVRAKLESAVIAVKELSDGYALQIEPSQLPLRDLAGWIDLEQKCCPFFHFAVEVEPDGGPIWLRLTGGEGVKDFIRDEIARGDKS